MNNNTYYHLYYSYCNRTQTALSPVSDEKRFPRVWRKANSFWEEKKHVEWLSDTGLIKVLCKLPCKWFCDWARNKQTYCMSDLTTWLTDTCKSDWPARAATCCIAWITDAQIDMTEWLSDWQMTAWLADTTDFHALTWYQTAFLTWVIKLTNKLTALSTKKFADAQTDSQTDRQTDRMN